jgi:hypothetical protein
MRGSRPKAQARKEPKRSQYPVTLTPEERRMNQEAEASLDRKEVKRRAGREPPGLPGEPELPGVEDGIKVIEAWNLGFRLGNVLKYIRRNGDKGDRIQNLQKARWYLDREIAALEATERTSDPDPQPTSIQKQEVNASYREID